MTLPIDSIIYQAFYFGLISACSLPLGALTTLFWKPSDRTIAFLMAFGGGALLAALTLDLVAGTVTKGYFYPLAAGCIAGGVLFIGLNQVVNDFGGFVRKASTQIYHLRRIEHRRFRRILSALKRVDVFKNLTDNDFRILADSIYNWEVKKGTLIFSQGEPCDELYFIASGHVELLDPSEQVESLQLRKNDDLGWLAYVTGTPYRFTARAIENTNLWVLPKSTFANLIPTSLNLFQSVQRWLHNDKVIHYLQTHHNLSADQINSWRDSAIKDILHHRGYRNAVKIEHDSDAFKKIANHINGFNLFKQLPERDLEIIASRLVYKHFSKGNTFFHEGEFADHLYIIKKGSVSILDPLGRFSHTIDLKTMDAFGYIAFVTGSRYTMSAIALEETDVWVLRRKDLNELIRMIPEITRRISQFLKEKHTVSYLVERQHFAQNKAEQWRNKSIKNIASGKDIIPVMSLNLNVGNHAGAPLGIWLGLMLDSIPEALVIGASLTHSHLSFSLLSGLFFSNYPEALSSSAGMRQQGMKFDKILLMWTILMFTTGILSALGNIYFEGVSHSVFAFTEGLAAGAMLTMIAQTMLPEAYFKGGEIIGFSTLLGFLTAIFFKTMEYP